MPRTSHRRPPADLLRRLFAVGVAALVLALSVFAASPVLHDWLHGHERTNDDGCAVVLFAGGVSLPLDAPTVTPPVAAWREIPLSSAADVFLTSPRYLRQPERGPPGLG